ncbi:MAG: DUF6542 domain-containing protein [Candidatus Nanopelagicales bacterium]
MTVPAPGPQDAGWGRSPAPRASTGQAANTGNAGRTGPAGTTGQRPAKRRRGVPGGRVVTLASLAVIVMALAEASVHERIGLWTGVTLIVVAIIGPLVTRSGDRSLPAMMPPLAFLVAVLIAGQLLLPEASSARSQQVLMLVQTLGPNAAWVVAATILSTGLAAIRHLADR